MLSVAFLTDLTFSEVGTVCTPTPLPRDGGVTVPDRLDVASLHPPLRLPICAVDRAIAEGVARAKLDVIRSGWVQTEKAAGATQDSCGIGAKVVHDMYKQSLPANALLQVLQLTQVVARAVYEKAARWGPG